MSERKNRDWKKTLKFRYIVYLFVLGFLLWYILGGKGPEAEDLPGPVPPPESGIRFKGNYQIELIAEGRRVEEFRILTDGRPILLDPYIPGGYTEISYQVTADGTVQGVRVTNTCGDSYYDTRARGAVESWEYSAKKQEQIKVRMYWSNWLIKIEATPSFDSGRNIRKQLSASKNFRVGRL